MANLLTVTEDDGKYKLQLHEQPPVTIDTSVELALQLESIARQLKRRDLDFPLKGKEELVHPDQTGLQL